MLIKYKQRWTSGLDATIEQDIPKNKSLERMVKQKLFVNQNVMLIWLLIQYSHHIFKCLRVWCAFIILFQFLFLPDLDHFKLLWELRGLHVNLQHYLILIHLRIMITLLKIIWGKKIWQLDSWSGNRRSNLSLDTTNYLWWELPCRKTTKGERKTYRRMLKKLGPGTKKSNYDYLATQGCS